MDSIISDQMCTVTNNILTISFKPAATGVSNRCQFTFDCQSTKQGSCQDHCQKNDSRQKDLLNVLKVTSLLGTTPIYCE